MTFPRYQSRRAPDGVWQRRRRRPRRRRAVGGWGGPHPTGARFFFPPAFRQKHCPQRSHFFGCAPPVVGTNNTRPCAWGPQCPLFFRGGERERAKRVKKKNSPKTLARHPRLACRPLGATREVEVDPHSPRPHARRVSAPLFFGGKGGPPCPHWGHHAAPPQARGRGAPPGCAS